MAEDPDPDAWLRAELGRQLEELFVLVWRLEAQWRAWPWLKMR